MTIAGENFYRPDVLHVPQPTVSNNLRNTGGLAGLTVPISVDASSLSLLELHRPGPGSPLLRSRASSDGSMGKTIW